jgi:hypothetical protein
MTTLLPSHLDPNRRRYLTALSAALIASVCVGSACAFAQEGFRIEDGYVTVGGEKQL